MRDVYVLESDASIRLNDAFGGVCPPPSQTRLVFYFPTNHHTFSQTFAAFTFLPLAEVVVFLLSLAVHTKACKPSTFLRGSTRLTFI